MDQNQTNQTLIDELGLSDLPQKKQEQLVIKMTEVLLKRIFLETMEKLNDHDKEEYEKMVENKAAPEQMEEFLKSKIKNYDDMTEEIVAKFKQEIKQGANF